MSSDSLEMVGVSLLLRPVRPFKSRLWFRLSCHVRPGRAGAARLLHLPHAGTKQQQWHPRDTVHPLPLLAGTANPPLPWLEKLEALLPIMMRTRWRL